MSASDPMRVAVLCRPAPRRVYPPTRSAGASPWADPSSSTRISICPHPASVHGVFAAGDVRAGSTKQLGSAVGDGIAALLMVRRCLEDHRQVAAHVMSA
jgi:hypothetical protein